MEKKTIGGKKKLFTKGRIILLSILLLIIAVRIWFPYFLLKVVNQKLNEIDGYSGHVDDIDLHLYRGAYRIDGLDLMKTGGEIPVPFFSVSAIDISIEWKALLDGAIVAEISLERPEINFVNGPTEATTQKGVDDKDWQTIVDELIPLQINKFEVIDGEVHFRDYSKSPKVNLIMSDIQVLATNLSNSKDSKELLPSTLTASAAGLDGIVNLNMKLNALSKQPLFDLNAQVNKVNMVKLNPFFQAYANFDVSKGDFSLYTEFAGRDGKFSGYAKPLITNLDVVTFSKEEGTIAQIAWEAVIGSVAEVFQNQKKEQLGTQIPISGNFNNPDINLWATIGIALRNAFIQALNPKINNTITIEDVGEDDKKGFFKALFNNDDKSGAKTGKKEPQKEESRKDRKKKKEKKDD